MARGLASGFDWGGASGRGAFAAALAAVAIPLLWLWLGPARVEGWSRWHEAAGVVPLALLTVPALGMAVRRLHDAGRAGGWAWLLALPWLRWALVLALLLLPSGARPRITEGPGRLLGLGLGIAVALGVLLSLVFATAWVSDRAMAPALRAGDLLLLWRAPLTPRRGDVLLVRLPGEAAPRPLRVVGLPGERVAVAGGLPVIGGVPARQERAGFLTEPFRPEGAARAMPLCGNGAVGLGAGCTTRLLRETLPDGTAQTILDVGPGPLDDRPEVAVPPGHLFLLGDARDGARDSRLSPNVGGAGLVPLDAVEGRALLVLWSAAGASPWDPRGWRPSRLLGGVP